MCAIIDVLKIERHHLPAFMCSDGSDECRLQCKTGSICSEKIKGTERSILSTQID